MAPIKRSATSAFIAVTFAFAAPAHAVEYLTQIESEVHHASGMTVDQIVLRAHECIKSASGNDARAVDSAYNADTAYAVVETRYKLSAIMPQDFVRSRVTVFARPERFKILHTDIEHNDTNPFTGIPLKVHTAPGGGARQIDGALRARSEAIAACITQPSPASSSDW